MIKVLEKLGRSIGFTPNEAKIVFVLVAAFLIGGALKLAGVSTYSERSVNYSVSDSDYARKTRTLAQSLSSGDSSLIADSDDDDADDAQTSATAQPVTYPLDINSATKEQIMTLPGIGEATAERIVAYREQYGRFSSLNQLREIKGIGDKRYEQLQPYLKLGN